MLDYYIVFVDDCSATSGGPAAHAATLSNINQAFGVVVQAADLYALWQTGAARGAAPVAVGSAGR